MKQETASFKDRMRQQTLAFRGSLCVFAGLFSGLAMNLMVDMGDLRRAEAQATRLGGAVATGMFVLLGIVLIVAQFVRRKCKRATTKSAAPVTDSLPGRTMRND